MPVTIEIRGLETVLVHTSKLGAFDPFRLMTLIGNTVRNQTVRHFQEGAGPRGVFAPLKESTLKRRPNRAPPAKPLSDTGRLKGSISANIAGLQAEIGTNVFYGKYHQSGTRKMVARPFLGLSEQDSDEVRRVVETFILSLTA